MRIEKYFKTCFNCKIKTVYCERVMELGKIRFWI